MCQRQRRKVWASVATATPKPLTRVGFSAGSAEAGEAGASAGAEERAPPSGTLVVLPKSIMSQWAQELHDKVRASLLVLTAAGTALQWSNA